MLNPFKSWFKKRPVNSYKGAEVSRLTMDWITSCCTPDEAVRRDARRLRMRARELALNNPLIVRYRALLKANVIGHCGIQLDAQVTNNSGALNEAINEKIEDAWKDWGEDVSVDGKFSLVQFQHLAIDTVATDGEVFIRLIRDPEVNKNGIALQFFDADWIDHEYNVPRGETRNEIRLGIEINKWGRPIAFWINYFHPNEILNRVATGDKRVRVLAEDIIHIYDPDRINQTRGTSWFNSIMFTLKMQAGYQEAEVVAARTASCQMGILEWSDPAAYNPSVTDTTPQIPIEPGTFADLPPGRKFSSWSPEHPTSAYPSFIKEGNRLIATGLKVSYNVLCNDLEGVSFSSIRTGVLNERDQWKILQRLWIDKFCKRLYPAWLKSSILTRTLILDSRDFTKFLAVKWQPRGWDWVDPLRDIQATILEINNGLGSRDNSLAERGLDIEDVFEQLAKEKEMAASYGLEFQATTQPTSKPVVDKQGDATTSDTQANNRMILNLLAEE